MQPGILPFFGSFEQHLQPETNPEVRPVFLNPFGDRSVKTSISEGSNALIKSSLSRKDQSIQVFHPGGLVDDPGIGAKKLKRLDYAPEVSRPVINDSDFGG